MLKLYKKEPDKTFYWEAWYEEDEIIIHFGELGKAGETNSLPLPEFEPPETFIESEAQLARDAGFDEIEQDEMFELLVRYPLKNKGGLEDLETSYKLESLLNDTLGWTGLGYCEMHDRCDEYITVYSYVVDPALAVQPLVSEFTCAGFLDDVVVAFQDRNEQFIVLWPENYTGIFEY